MKWLYERTPDNSARFVLGTVGENPLVCFGDNAGEFDTSALPELIDTAAAALGRAEQTDKVS